MFESCREPLDVPSRLLSLKDCDDDILTGLLDERRTWSDPDVRNTKPVRILFNGSSFRDNKSTHSGVQVSVHVTCSPIHKILAVLDVIPPRTSVMVDRYRRPVVPIRLAHHGRSLFVQWRWGLLVRATW
jgi:hypothetical protein